MFDVLTLQQKLVAVAGAPGMEKSSCELISELARPFVDEITVDPMGNIHCIKKGKPDGKRIYMPAHRDAVGFLVTHVDEQGYVWFDPIGSFLPAALVGERVVFQNGIRGTIYMKNITEFFDKPLSVIDTDDLYIDIGAQSGEQAREHINIGDWARYDSTAVRVGDDCIMTPYADDLAGCVTLLLALEQVGETDNELVFAFTVQEELGTRGAQASAYDVEPDFIVACDGCRTGDTPKNDEVPMEVKVGHGPGLKLKDCGMVCSELLNDHLKAAALDAGVVWQPEIMRYGMTDASISQRVRGARHASCISIPMRHLHSPCEIFSEKDVVDAARMFARFCERKL